MKLFWQHNKIIIIFFVALSTASVMGVVSEDVEEKPKSLAEILKEPINLKSRNRDERMPASIDSGNSQATKKPNQKLTLQAFCKPEVLQMKMNEHLVALEISSCIDLREKHQLWVKNETNGFKAQIFKMDSSLFKTDFIQLSKGMNKLILEGILKDGQKVVQTLEILSGS